MSWTQDQTGTKTADGTEQTLGSASTTNATYLLLVDCVNMALLDELELRAKIKILTGGTARVLYLARYMNAQEELAKITVPVPSIYSVTFTLKQVAGTNRAYDWEIWRQ